MGNVNAETSMQEQGLGQLYYWISILTFNLVLWEWLLFPKEQADLGLRPGLLGHKQPHRDLGVMERQYMVNIHDKSPVRQALIPLTKHGGHNIISEATVQYFKTQKAELPQKLERATKKLIWGVFLWQIYD